MHIAGLRLSLSLLLKSIHLVPIQVGELHQAFRLKLSVKGGQIGVAGFINHYEGYPRLAQQVHRFNGGELVEDGFDIRILRRLIGIEQPADEGFAMQQIGKYIDLVLHLVKREYRYRTVTGLSCKTGIQRTRLDFGQTIIQTSGD